MGSGRGGGCLTFQENWGHQFISMLMHVHVAIN